MTKHRLPVEERFWPKVDFDGPIVVAELGPCWLWTGGPSSKGYGVFRLPQSRRVVAAHRVAFALWLGVWAPVLDHLCRTRLCVNPMHLDPVTHRQNIMRGEGSAPKLAAQTHCKRGHEFTVENTIRKGPEGRWRTCRTCYRKAMREGQRRYLARRKAALA